MMVISAPHRSSLHACKLVLDDAGPWRMLHCGTAASTAAITAPAAEIDKGLIRDPLGSTPKVGECGG